MYYKSHIIAAIGDIIAPNTSVIPPVTTEILPVMRPLHGSLLIKSEN